MNEKHEVDVNTSEHGQVGLDSSLILMGVILLSTVLFVLGSASFASPDQMAGAQAEMARQASRVSEQTVAALGMAALPVVIYLLSAPWLFASGSRQVSNRE